MRRISHMRTLPGKQGFTLIEMLVAVTVLVILLGILFSITSTVAKTVTNTSVKVDTFAAARSAFDLMSQKLSQATLNTYWDYNNPVTPTTYYRQSDLQFYVRPNVQKAGYGQEVYFVTPSTYSTRTSLRSTDGLLNACGFYVSYGPDTTFRPGTLTGTSRYRYRLMQGLEPTENLAVYSNWTATPTTTFSTGTAAAAATWVTANTTAWNNYWTSMTTIWNTHAWITNTIGNTGSTPNVNVTPLVNNVIALIVWPRLSDTDDPPILNGTPDGGKLTSTYTYDSQGAEATLASGGVQPITSNQLPPTVQVTMIAISESSASRLNLTATQPTVIDNILSGASLTPSTPAPFTISTYTQYQADLARVSAALAANHIGFEILNTSVTMKESKWSDNSQ